MKPYKGYVAVVEMDVEAGVLLGHVADIGDVVTFQAERVADLEAEFHTSVDIYLETCSEIGKVPSKPHSGRFVVRTSPERHAAIVRAAAASGKSMNLWIADALTAAAGAAEYEPDQVVARSGRRNVRAAHSPLATEQPRSGRYKAATGHSPWQRVW